MIGGTFGRRKHKPEHHDAARLRATTHSQPPAKATTFHVKLVSPMKQRRLTTSLRSKHFSKTEHFNIFLLHVLNRTQNKLLHQQLSPRLHSARICGWRVGRDADEPVNPERCRRAGRGNVTPLADYLRITNRPPVPRQPHRTKALVRCVQMSQFAVAAIMTTKNLFAFWRLLSARQLEHTEGIGKRRFSTPRCLSAFPPRPAPGAAAPPHFGAGTDRHHTGMMSVTGA